ncbi:unnamed protein product [Cuscuta campestris]|uniref:Uncharacterized protein n=1 Tax=Cuscuta campestris TaxID=132261 RepID=A0A484KCB5_9ASTE|nr:unnamed protein product [Cuscuta campestris]
MASSKLPQPQEPNPHTIDISRVQDEDTEIPSTGKNGGGFGKAAALYYRLIMIRQTLSGFEAGYFRISLSLSSQALLWKTLARDTTSIDDFNHSFGEVVRMLPSAAFVFLWSLALFVLASLSLLYAARCLLCFEVVREEFRHHVHVNYLFAPSISGLLLLQATPFFNQPAPPLSTGSTTQNPYYMVLWYVLVAPIIVLDLKIYGQWLTKGKRFLSGIANPTSQLSVVGNLVGATAAARLGWRETAVCMFALGMAHYLVLFVTLYQRLPGSSSIPVMLRPVFFLFIAAPSMASLAWDSISGSFDTLSKMFFYLSLFLFMSLVCRPTLFRESMRKYNVVWWAYSFPITVIAIASTKYAQEVKRREAHILMLFLSALSVVVSLLLLVTTALTANCTTSSPGPTG